MRAFILASAETTFFPNDKTEDSNECFEELVTQCIRFIQYT